MSSNHRWRFMDGTTIPIDERIFDALVGKNEEIVGLLDDRRKLLEACVEADTVEEALSTIKIILDRDIELHDELLRLEKLEAELTALKARSCAGCDNWRQVDPDDTYANCAMDVEVDDGNIRFDFSCAFWEAKEEG